MEIRNINFGAVPVKKLDIGSLVRVNSFHPDPEQIGTYRRIFGISPELFDCEIGLICDPKTKVITSKCVQTGAADQIVLAADGIIPFFDLIA